MKVGKLRSVYKNPEVLCMSRTITSSSSSVSSLSTSTISSEPPPVPTTSLQCIKDLITAYAASLKASVTLEKEAEAKVQLPLGNSNLDLSVEALYHDAELYKLYTSQMLAISSESNTFYTPIIATFLERCTEQKDSEKRFSILVETSIEAGLVKFLCETFSDFIPSPSVAKSSNIEISSLTSERPLTIECFCSANSILRIPERDTLISCLILQNIASLLSETDTSKRLKKIRSFMRSAMRAIRGPKLVEGKFMALVPKRSWAHFCVKLFPDADFEIPSTSSKRKRTTVHSYPTSTSISVTKKRSRGNQSSTKKPRVPDTMTTVVSIVTPEDNLNDNVPSRNDVVDEGEEHQKCMEVTDQNDESEGTPTKSRSEDDGDEREDQEIQQGEDEEDGGGSQEVKEGKDEGNKVEEEDKEHDNEDEGEVEEGEVEEGEVEEGEVEEYKGNEGVGEDDEEGECSEEGEDNLSNRQLELKLKRKDEFSCDLIGTIGTLETTLKRQFSLIEELKKATTFAEVQRLLEASDELSRGLSEMNLSFHDRECIVLTDLPPKYPGLLPPPKRFIFDYVLPTLIFDGLKNPRPKKMVEPFTKDYAGPYFSLQIPNTSLCSSILDNKELALHKFVNSQFPERINGDFIEANFHVVRIPRDHYCFYHCVGVMEKYIRGIRYVYDSQKTGAKSIRDKLIAGIRDNLDEIFGPNPKNPEEMITTRQRILFECESLFSEPERLEQVLKSLSRNKSEKAHLKSQLREGDDTTKVEIILSYYSTDLAWAEDWMIPLVAKIFKYSVFPYSIGRYSSAENPKPHYYRHSTPIVKEVGNPALIIVCFNSTHWNLMLLKHRAKNYPFAVIKLPGNVFGWDWDKRNDEPAKKSRLT